MTFFIQQLSLYTMVPFMGKNELSFLGYHSDILFTVLIFPLVSFIILFVGNS